MIARRFKKILIIGENHQEVAARYSADTRVAEYPFADMKGAAKRHRTLVQNLRFVLRYGELSPGTVKELKGLYFKLRDMTDEEYFAQVTKGCTIKDDGNAYSTSNPHAFYRYQVTPKNLGDTFMEPFTLLDGTKTFSARKGDIDWKLMHMHDADLHAREWELAVEGQEPASDDEKALKEAMLEKMNYLCQFGGKEEYVNHTSAFWCFGVGTDRWFLEADNLTDEKRWIADFYGEFVKGLPDDAVLTLYETRTL